MSPRDLGIASLWRPFQLCFQEPILLVLNVYLGLIYALLYTWFEAFPIVFTGIYLFNPGQNRLAFLGIVVGAIVIVIPYLVWLYFVQKKYLDEDGNMEPERHLPPAVFGSFLIPICLFWFEWSSRPALP